MYETRQPITNATIKAELSRAASAILSGTSPAIPKPLVSNAAGAPREMSVAVMGEWLRARPGVTDKDIAKEFTAAERERFLDAAIDYAIRRSGDMH